MKRLREEDEALLAQPRLFHFVTLIKNLSFKQYPTINAVLAYAFSMSSRWRGQVTFKEAYSFWLVKQVLIEVGQLPIEILQNEIPVEIMGDNTITRSECDKAVLLEQPLLVLMIQAYNNHTNNRTIYFSYLGKRWALFAEHATNIIQLCLFTTNEKNEYVPLQVLQYRSDKVLLMRLKTVLETLPANEFSIAYPRNWKKRKINSIL